MLAAAAASLLATASALPTGYPTTVVRGVSGPIDMPMVGIGTWLYNNSVARQAVTDAFSLGYRAVDTAYVYQNHVGVGQGLAAAAAAAGLKREDYFVTSKIPGGLNTSATNAALESSLQDLGLDYVDLMLLHFPAGFDGQGGSVLRKEEWLALERWTKGGGARAVGVSHYCERHLRDVLDVATLPVAVNQNQYHVGMGLDSQPRLHDKAFTEAEGILFQSYSPLCGPCPEPDNMELITGALVSDIGARHNKTGAQVALRWLVQQGIPIIPKSRSRKHMGENFDVFNFTLSHEEMWRLSTARVPAETGTKDNPDDAQDCETIDVQASKIFV